MKSALAYHDVHKAYGKTKALAGLNLTIPSGSIFGLVGSNGAGKTTAMSIAVGLLRTDCGTIDLLENGSFDPLLHSGRVSVLPQDSRMPPHARVDDLLAYYGRLQGLPEAEIPGTVQQVLDAANLLDRRTAAIRTLSHGMARRLAVAQAFLGSPELVLLDEPLNGLDPREAARARDMIRARRGHQTIVISSHQLSDIEAVCDTVAFIEHGSCVRQDNLESMVKKAHQISFLLTAPAPMPKITASMPDVSWEWNQQTLKLTANFTPPRTPEMLNEAVCRILFDAGTGLLEIHRGSNLETEYLSASATDHNPNVGYAHVGGFKVHGSTVVRDS